jgi:hypothetical protein
MIRAIRRELAWKSKRRFERALRDKRRLEKIQEELKPTDVFHNGGVAVKVHAVRTFRGTKEFFYEFGRYETDRNRFFFKQVLSEFDLDDLEEAVREAKSYKQVATGIHETRRSNDSRSQAPIRWSHRK